MLPRIKVTPYFYMVMVLSIFWGIVLVTMLTGIWTTSVSRIPVTQTVSAEQVTTDIKGWMTFKEISGHTNVALQDLYTLMNLPVELPPTTSLKDAANLYGFTADDFKEKLQTFMKHRTP